MARMTFFVIMERLAHPHDDDVGQLLLFALEASGEIKNLSGDFAGGQVPRQAHLPGCAERAIHRAAGLRRDTDRIPIAVAHQDRLDFRLIAQREKVFFGQPG